MPDALPSKNVWQEWQCSPCWGASPRCDRARDSVPRHAASKHRKRAAGHSATRSHVPLVPSLPALRTVHSRHDEQVRSWQASDVAVVRLWRVSVSQYKL